MKTINSIILSINLFNILCYNVDLIQGIRGGVDVPDGKFMYQAIVLINGAYACGGALLTDDTVLSAGQCVLNDQGYFLDVTFEVIVGVTSFHPEDTNGKIKVDYIYVKFTFRQSGSSPADHSFPGTLEKGDLAVLKLQGRIPNNLHVSYLQLPAMVGSVYLRYSAKTLNVSGFGLNIGIDYKSSSDLSNMESRLNLFGQLTYTQTYLPRDSICQSSYRLYDRDHVCGKSANYVAATGPCLGDAGDPLVWDNEIVGVMQYYTENCDNRLRPAVYTRVSSFIPFIENARDRSYQNDMRLGNYTGPHVIEEPRIRRD